jgi:hypothetical protein
MNYYFVTADRFSSDTDPREKGTNVFPYLENYGRIFSGESMDVSRSDAETFLTVAGDFLTDMFHLAAEHGVSPEDLIAQAARHFTPERDRVQVDESGCVVCDFCAVTLDAPVRDYLGDGICPSCHVHSVGDWPASECEPGCSDCEENALESAPLALTS